MKPFSESSEENKLPILRVLQQEFAAATHVLEIGSGTGQHAVFFAQQLAHLRWQPSDVPANLPGIELWCREFPSANLASVISLDVDQTNWPAITIDAVFSANTSHIMHWPSVKNMFAGIGALLPPQGLFCLYGPFNYHGSFTSESNARFDQWLKQRDPGSGIRDMDDLQILAQQHSLQLLRDHTMPVNNRILVWQRME